MELSLPNNRRKCWAPYTDDGMKTPDLTSLGSSFQENISSTAASLAPSTNPASWVEDAGVWQPSGPALQMVEGRLRGGGGVTLSDKVFSGAPSAALRRLLAERRESRRSRGDTGNSSLVPSVELPLPAAGRRRWDSCRVIRREAAGSSSMSSGASFLCGRGDIRGCLTLGSVVWVGEFMRLADRRRGEWMISSSCDMSLENTQTAAIIEGDCTCNAWTSHCTQKLDYGHGQMQEVFSRETAKNNVQLIQMRIIGIGIDCT